MSKRSKSAAPLVSEELDEYIHRTTRIPPARQICIGSSREVYERPRNDKCPVCERAVDIQEVSTGRRDPLTRDLIMAYLIPSHMARRAA